MMEPSEYAIPKMELLATFPREDNNKVVVQAKDDLMIFSWIKIDEQDGLGGGKYYGGFNFVIDDYARDPTTGEVYDHLLATSDNKVLRVADVAAALLKGEVEINIIPEAETASLILGKSLREVRLRREKNTQAPAEKIELLRTYKHCSRCTQADCYCSRR